MNKKLFILIPAIALLLGACNSKSSSASSSNSGNTSSQTSDSGSEASVPVTGISLSSSAETVAIGEHVTLVATVTPNNATNKKVTWASDAEAVATVANGRVTAVADGTAHITATTEDGNFSASCTITVPPATNYGTEDNPLTPAQLHALVEPLAANAWLDEMVWCEGVVFQSSWYATGSSLNGWLQNGDTDQGIQLYGVKKGEEVSQDFTADNAAVGYTFKIHGYVQKFSTWGEFNKKTVSGETVYPEIKVATAPSGDPTGVRMLSGDDSVDIGATLNLDARLVPLSAAGTITYESSDPSKASIAGKVLTGVSAGSVTVKAICGGLESAPINITVNTPSYVAKVDFTKKTAAHSSYTDGEWTYAGWKIDGGANNGAGWEFIKLGKKAGDQTSTISSPLVASAASEVVVELPAGSLNKTGMSVTSWGVKAYSDEAHETQVAAVAGNTADIVKTATSITLSGTFPANSYYVVYFSTSNTSTTNGVVCVSSVTINA